MFNPNKKFHIYLTLLILLITSGCALMHEKQNSQEEMLTKRVNLAWQAKLDNTFSNVYDMTIAAFKAEVSKEKFLRGANVTVSAYSVKKIELTDSKEKATVTINYTITPIGQKFNLTSKEEWLLEDGEWRLNLLPALRPPLPGMSKAKKK